MSDPDDDREGARREVIQAWKHQINLAREAAERNRHTAQAFARRAAGVKALPPNVLHDYADAARDEAASLAELADALEGEAAKR